MQLSQLLYHDKVEKKMYSEGVVIEQKKELGLGGGGRRGVYF
jgi:hypothetical protein